MQYGWFLIYYAVVRLTGFVVWQRFHPADAEVILPLPGWGGGGGALSGGSSSRPRLLLKVLATALIFSSYIRAALLLSLCGRRSWSVSTLCWDWFLRLGKGKLYCGTSCGVRLV